MGSPSQNVRSYDVIVAGVGAAGSAAAFHLARRGLRVLGLDRFDVPNSFGSSHGVTRIIRLAYYEHPSYVPLLLRAYELWQELERSAQQALLVTTGSVDASLPGGELFDGALRACRLYDLPHEVLDARELARRYPAYRLPRETVALLQPRGGFLLPERCIAAHALLAESHGATLLRNEPALAWEPAGDGVRVKTARAEYAASHLVVATGSWTGTLVPTLAALLVPERQVLAWLAIARPEHFAPSHMPVFNIAVEEGRFYGFPEFGTPGFKLGKYHHLREAVHPDHVDREVHEQDIALLRDFARRYFPAGAGPALSATVCLFTNTPDEHFILDRLADLPQVVIAAACSGHGFKFASVVGEIVADLVERGETRHDITLLRLARFASPGVRAGTEAS